jgi:hypothetical protein
MKRPGRTIKFHNDLTRERDPRPHTSITPLRTVFQVMRPAVAFWPHAGQKLP